MSQEPRMDGPLDSSAPTQRAALNRRAFLARSAVAAGCGVLATGAAPAERNARRPAGWVDVNVSLSQWPFRRVPCDTLPRLVDKLRSQGVAQAWVGSFEGLVHKDLASVNRRLVELCAQAPRSMLLPFGSVNPRAPDWQDDLRRCAEVHRMRGIRLHPNYHGYGLDHPALATLLQLATERHLVVQIALEMEDERMMHPLGRLPAVETQPLADLVRTTPGLRLVLLNALRRLSGEALARILAAGDVSVEIAMLEGVGGLGNLLRQTPAGRVLFGSHTPLYYFEAAALKLRESAIPMEQANAITRTNAQRLLSHPA